MVPAAAFAQTADLQVLVTTDLPDVDPGDTLTFTVTVFNGGPDDADNVTLVIDLLSGGVAVNSQSATGGIGTTCNGTLDCTFDLLAGDTVTVTIVTFVDDPIPPSTFIDMRALIGSSGTFDPTDENNESYTGVFVNGSTAADLGVSVAPPPAGIEAGHTGTFIATLTNGGPSDSSGATFNFAITAPGVSTIGAISAPAGWTCAGTSCTPDSSIIPAGANLTFTVDVTVDPATGIGDQVTAAVSVTSPNDPNTENDAVTLIAYVVGPETATALSISDPDPLVGGTVTFTATVTPTSSGPVNNGTVTFYANGSSLGMAQNVSGGTASLIRNDLPAGSYDVTAVYTGFFFQFQDSTSAPQTLTVHKHDTTTALATSPNPVVFGETVTLTATVDQTTSADTPTGTVTFYDGATALGSVPLSGGGTAVFSTDTLEAGTHNLSATYEGDATFDVSTSAAVGQTTNPAASGTTLTSSANPSIIGTAVTFTATVASTAGTPSGTVTFYDGTTVLGTETLTAGSASVTTSTLTLGDHEISAVYSGEPNFAGSTSATLTQQILVDTAAVEAVFNELTEDFIDVRSKLLADHIKTPGLQGGQGGPTAGLGGSPQSPELNFAANTRSLTGAGSAAEALAFGEASQPFGFWIDGTLALHQRPGAGGQFALLGMGADYLVNDALLAGVALYLDYMTDTTTTGDVVGRGALIGPYVSAELADGLFFDASLLVGRSWNDAHATLFGADFTGSFVTNRWMLNSSLSGDFELGDILVRPDVSLDAASESSDAYTVTGGGASVTIGAVTVETFRVSAGAELSRAFVLENGLVFTPFVGARSGGGTSVFATLTGGFTLEGEAWKANLEAQLNGDTTGLRSQSVRIGIGGRF